MKNPTDVNKIMKILRKKTKSEKIEFFARGKIIYKPAPIMQYDRSYRCRISRVCKIFTFWDFHQFRTAFGRISSPDGTKFPEILGIYENRSD